MSDELKRLIVNFATNDEEEFNRYLASLVENNEGLINLIRELLTMYFNDLNSSTMRELVTLLFAGWHPFTEKLGYNGFKLDEPTECCEVKLKNVRRSENGVIRRKLDGGGSFNDYTPERLERHKQENPKILISGFFEGKLIYIIEIPFECLVNKLEQQLNNRFGGRSRQVGEYLRSASFSFADYKDCESIRIIFPRKRLTKFDSALNRNFADWLWEKVKDE